MEAQLTTPPLVAVWKALRDFMQPQLHERASCNARRRVDARAATSETRTLMAS